MGNDTYSTADLENFLARFYIGKSLLITPYGYAVSFLAFVGATGNATQVVNIAANADFVLLGIHHRAALTATQTVSNKTAPFVRMLCIDSGTNEQFTNAAVDIENYSQNGNFVNNLPYPRILSGRSTLTVQLIGYAPLAETYSSIEIFFEGVLVKAY